MSPRRSLPVLVALTGALGACNKEEPPTPIAAAPPVAAASGAAAGKGAAAASAPTPPSGPSCVVEDEQRWGAGANLRTGITETVLSDGRLALGIAFGNRPAVLVIDANGKGSVVRPTLSDRSALSKELKGADGRRDLQRVTPAAAPGGGVRALADYRDKLEKTDERRITCGATDADEPLLTYFGKPLLDVDDSGKGRTLPTAPPAASVAPAASAAPPAGSAPPDGSGRPALTAVPRASGEAPPEPAEPPEEKPKRETERELRDCRSIVDPGGEATWALGSELVGEPGEGDTTKWSMRFFARGSGGTKTRLTSISLGKAPKKLHTFENPVAWRLEDGSYAVAARYQGALYAWLLDQNKRPRGGSRVYRGGYPTLPRFSLDGSQALMVLSQKTGEDRYGLWFGGFSVTAPALPSLTGVTFDDIDPSLSEPNVASIPAGRWMSLQAGKRSAGRLVLVPVDATLRPRGPAVPVGDGKGAVNESRLFALSSGKLLLAYLHTVGSSTELVTHVVGCKG